MKNTLLKLKIMLVWILLSVKGIAQNKADNVIILADVSEFVLSEVTNPHIIAPAALYPLISGAGLNTAYPFTPIGKQRLPKIWIDEKKKLMVVPFGDLNTDKNSIALPANEYSNSKKDFFKDAINEKWPELARYKDKSAYRKLAIARAAYLAKKNRFYSYWLLIVGGRIGSEKNEASLSEKDAQNVLNSYKALLDKPIGTIYLADRKKKFAIEVRHIVLDSTSKSPSPPSPCTITFTKPSSKDLRIELDKSKAILNWNCNCDNIGKYIVTVKGVDGAEVNPSLKTKETDNSYVNLKDLCAGKYNITVTTSGASSTAYMTVKSSNLVIWLIGIVLIVIAGYYRRNNIKSLWAAFGKKGKKPQAPDDSGKYNNPNITSGY